LGIGNFSDICQSRLHWQVLYFTSVPNKTIVISLRSLSTKTSGKLNILWLDSNSLGMDGSQVSVFNEINEVGLTGFSECSNGGRLESQVCLKILGNLTNETLERELSRFLVTIFGISNYIRPI
jgi:hypothetical protein